MDLTEIADDRRGTDETPPDFTDWESPDDLLQGGPVRERIRDVILQLRDPTKVSVVAERADCDTETAREYLEWFAELGMVREYADRPARYERNDSYFRWRRIDRIRDQYTDDEIVDVLSETMAEIEAYRERFGAANPDAVSLTAAGREMPVEDAWETLSDWHTLERRAALLDAALRDAGVSGGQTDSADV